MAFDLRGRIQIDGGDAVRSMARVDREAKALDRSMGNAGQSLDKADRALDRAADGARSASSSFSRLERVAAGAGTALRRFGTVGGTVFRGVATGARSLIGRLTSLQSLIAGMGAGYLGVYKPLQLSMDHEQAEIAFETMIGNAERAQQFLGELEQFALDTPFDLPQLRDSARQLMAYGFSVEQILPTMESLGNASAGLGMGAEGIERMSRALGQVRAKGRLQAEEALQLMEVGVNVYDILAEAAGVSQAVIQDEMSKGLIPAEAAINILVEGIGARFPDMMEKQGKSLAGLFEQIKETFDNQILRSWGDGIAQELKPRIDAMRRWIDDNEATIAKWGSTLRQTASQATDWLATRFERAFNYISDNFINNPTFRDMTLEGKVSFAFERLKEAYDRWYNGGGKESIENVSSAVTSVLATGFKAAAPVFAEAGLEMGKSIGSGILDGIMSFADENPFMAALLVGGGTFVATKNPYLALAAGGGTLAYGTRPQHTRLPGITDEERAYAAGENPSYLTNRKIPGYDPSAGLPSNTLEDAMRGGTTPSLEDVMRGLPGYKSGLDYVPRDNYVARLHRGEMVLTAAEAREYRNLAYRADATTYEYHYESSHTESGGSGGLVINGDVIVQSTGAGNERYDAMALLREVNRLMAPLLPN